MNRKQKVAVVVGALALTVLALFPPWVYGGAAFAGAEPWRLTHGPTFILNPPAPPGRRMALTLTDSSDASVLTQEALEDLRRYYEHTAELDWASWLAHLAATLALTVAAVVVLIERRRARPTAPPT